MIQEFIGQQFLLAAIAAAIAGLVRGFSGFGPAMVFVPIAGALWGPAMAVPILFLVDTATTVPFVARAVGACRWREVLPIAAGGAIAIPLGIQVLVLTDPTLLRWILCGVILLSVAALASGWRYRGEPSRATAFGAGGLSGFGGGFAGLYGPPIILFWLGGQSAAATVRANIFVYLGLVAIVGGVSFWLSGLFTSDVLWLSVFLMPVYATALWVGSRFFGKTRETMYRRIALVMCTLAALVGLPLWN